MQTVTPHTLADDADQVGIDLEKLFDEAVFARPSPDDSIVLVWEHEAYAHDCQIVFHIHRRPPSSALVNLLALQA